MPTDRIMHDQRTHGRGAFECGYEAFETALRAGRRKTTELTWFLSLGPREAIRSADMPGRGQRTAIVRRRAGTDLGPRTHLWPRRTG